MRKIYGEMRRKEENEVEVRRGGAAWKDHAAAREAFLPRALNDGGSSLNASWARRRPRPKRFSQARDFFGGGGLVVKVKNLLESTLWTGGGCRCW
jgi:hypothetical protein